MSILLFFASTELEVPPVVRQKSSQELIVCIRLFALCRRVAECPPKQQGPLNPLWVAEDLFDNPDSLGVMLTPAGEQTPTC